MTRQLAVMELRFIRVNFTAVLRGDDRRETGLVR